jgi:ADP-ribosylglycohydrolase
LVRNDPDVADRARGALLGLAVGDALGATVEFMSPGSFAPVTDMIGGGPHRLQPGEWTDDTSMALCLAESLVECGGFDATDQMRRYVQWYREGYMSSTGSCFDIGNTTRAALHRFERDDEPFAGSTDPRSAGNGSIMRLAPVPIYYHHDPRAAISYAADSSRTTHAAAEAPEEGRGSAHPRRRARPSRGDPGVPGPAEHRQGSGGALMRVDSQQGTLSLTSRQ